MVPGTLPNDGGDVRSRFWGLVRGPENARGVTDMSGLRSAGTLAATATATVSGRVRGRRVAPWTLGACVGRASTCLWRAA